MKPTIFAIHNSIETVHHPPGHQFLECYEVFHLLETASCSSLIYLCQHPSTFLICSDSWSTANISSSEYPVFFTSVRKNVIFSKHVVRRSLQPFLASLPLLYSASSAPALMSRSSGRSCARFRHSSCPYPAVALRLRRYSRVFALLLNRI